MQHITGYDEGKAIATLAHDIKAPLSAIVSILAVIEKGYVKDIDKAKELVSRALQKSETLIEMINDLLDYTLLADKSLMKRDTVRLADVLKDSISTMEPYVRERNITLTYDRELCKGKYVNGSFTFLLRVFNNILMNAIKYNKENGKINVQCSEDTVKKTVAITAEDTGIGIPEDELGNVFRIFERGRYARKNINGSLGLGLSLVKQIVEDHDGEVGVTSTVGVGTTIKVTLPLLDVNKRYGGINEL